MSNNSNCGCHKEGKGEHNSHTGCGYVMKDKKQQ